MQRLPGEWREWLTARGERGFRGDQIFAWIHKRGVLDPEQMSNLPKNLRRELTAAGLADPLRLSHVHPSEDGTSKLLLRLADESTIETVLLPASARVHDADAAAAAEDEDEDEDEDDAAAEDESASPEAPTLPRIAVTQCISSQVGCAMGCVFCASGIAGLKRHLSAAEIIAQVIAGRRSLPPQQHLRNVVFMGMGEPLHNFEATVRAIELMIHPDGLGLAARRITVSTSGLVPEIDRLGAHFEGRIGLAISLHQADDAKRSALMPINDRYPLKALMASLRRYPLRRRRNITIEYTLVAGHNDSVEDARALSSLLSKLRVKVNLIPMNPIAHSDLGPPTDGRVSRFQAVLRNAGLLCFVRRRRGDDVSAACGQLALEGAEPNVRFLRSQPKE